MRLRRQRKANNLPRAMDEERVCLALSEVPDRVQKEGREVLWGPRYTGWYSRLCAQLPISGNCAPVSLARERL